MGVDACSDPLHPLCRSLSSAADKRSVSFILQAAATYSDILLPKAGSQPASLNTKAADTYVLHKAEHLALWSYAI
jgi:hypothetical protein